MVGLGVFFVPMPHWRWVLPWVAWCCFGVVAGLFTQAARGKSNGARQFASVVGEFPLLFLEGFLAVMAGRLCLYKLASGTV